MDPTAQPFTPSVMRQPSTMGNTGASGVCSSTVGKGLFSNAAVGSNAPKVPTIRVVKANRTIRQGNTTKFNGWHPPTRHETVVNIYHNRVLVDTRLGETFFETALIWPEYPLRTLVAASNYFARKFGNVPLTTTGHRKLIRDAQFSEADITDTALHHILTWWKIYKLPFSNNYEGNPQASLSKENIFLNASLFQAVSLFDLKHPFTKQWQLVKTLKASFDGAEISKEDIVHFWNCCKKDSQLTMTVINKVVDWIEWKDDQTDEFFRPYEHNYPEYFKQAPGLFEAYNAAVEAKAISLERRQKHEVWLQRKKRHQEKASISNALGRGGAKYCPHQKQNIEEWNKAKNIFAASGVRTMTAEQAELLKKCWQ